MGDKKSLTLVIRGRRCYIPEIDEEYVFDEIPRLKDIKSFLAENFNADEDSIKVTFARAVGYTKTIILEYEEVS